MGYLLNEDIERQQINIYHFGLVSKMNLKEVINILKLIRLILLSNLRL